MAHPRTLPFALAGVLAAVVALLVLMLGKPSVSEIGEFDGERAFAHVQKQVSFGPREPGSEAIAKAQDYIEAELRGFGWAVRREPFVAKTPAGELPMVNLRARFAGGGEVGDADPDWQRGGGMVLLCSHYDTKIMEGIRFDGANDGGSSTGVLLELARTLAGAPAIAARVELVFFDGEEAVGENIAINVDGLYGSLEYSKLWRRADPEARPEAAFVLDLVGDLALRIDPPNDSPRPLLLELYAAAKAVGVRSRFGMYGGEILDDHIHLNRAGIPALNVIDADYIRRGEASGARRWHTELDRLENVSPKSLKLIGDVMTQLLQERFGG